MLVLGVFFVGTAQAAEPIKIGGIFSLTALPSEMGSARDGVELAVKEFNEAGGLNGRMAELLVRDDKGEPGDAVRVAEELIFRDNVSAIVATTFLMPRWPSPKRLAVTRCLILARLDR